MIVHAENIHKIDILDICDLFTVAKDKILLKLTDTNINFWNNVIQLYKNKLMKQNKKIEFRDKYGESLLYMFILYNETEAVVTLLNNNVNIFEIPLTDKYTTIIQKALQLQQGNSFRVLLEKALISDSEKILNFKPIFSNIWNGHSRLQFRKQNVSSRVEYNEQANIQIFHSLMLNKIYCNYQYATEWFIGRDKKQTVFRKIIELLDTESNEEREAGVPTCLKNHPAKWTTQNELLVSHAGYRFGFNCNDCRQSNNEGRGAYHCKECLFDLCDACVAIFLMKLQEKKDIKNKNILQWSKEMLYITGFYQFDLDYEIEKYENETNQSKPNTKKVIQNIYNELKDVLLEKMFAIKFNNNATEYINFEYKELDKFLLFREYLRLYSYHNINIDNSKYIPISLQLYDTRKSVFVDLINTFKYGKIYVKRRGDIIDIIKMDELLHKLCVTYDIGKYIEATKYLRQTVTHKYKYETAIKLNSNDAIAKQDHSYGDSLSCILPDDFLGIVSIKLVSSCCDQGISATGGCFIGVQIIRNNILIRELGLIVINHFEHDGHYEWKNEIKNNDWELNCILPNDILKVRCFVPSEDSSSWTFKAQWIQFQVEYVLSKYKEN